MVKVGGVTLLQNLRLDSGTVQGIMRARPAGTVDVQAINPGAAAAFLPAAFSYLPVVSDPSLTGFTDLERIEVIEGITFVLERELARPGNSFYVVQ